MEKFINRQIDKQKGYIDKQIINDREREREKERENERDKESEFVLGKVCYFVTETLEYIRV